MEICPREKCTGCYACVNACPHGCIMMEEDKMGEVHPRVDEESCRKCYLCIKACPNNQSLEYLYPQTCYASWITDRSKRKVCASGGIGTILSEFVIKHKKGVVFGTLYDEALTPKTSYAEDLETLEKFKGSKYVQSLVGADTFRKIRAFLRDGRLVLYIATPCQIAGLLTFLHHDYDNLITVDLICHGVCPTSYLKKEVAYLTKKLKIGGVGDIRFRGNDGNNFCLTIWDAAKRKLYPRGNFFIRLLHIDDAQQYYLQGFLLGVSLRENCYSCNYSRPERISDITIGDFIGLGKHVPFDYPKGNVSSVTLNTDKAISFYKEVSSLMKELVNVEREYSERLEYGPSLRYAFPRHELNKAFRENYLKYGYVVGIRKTLGPFMRRRQIKQILHYWTLPYRAFRKAYRTIKSYIEK